MTYGTTERRPRAPLRCKRCGGSNTRIVDTRPDHELVDDLRDSADPADQELARVLAAAGVDSIVWRRRLCQDCGAVRASAELGVDGRQVRRRLSVLRSWRAGAHGPGWRGPSTLLESEA
jgi:hypothetical protein